MIRRYPKKFEEWFSRHEPVQNLRYHQLGEYKRKLFNAWNAGRRHQKSRAYAHGDVVRWT